MIGCIWHVLGALYGTRAKLGNNLANIVMLSHSSFFNLLTLK